MLYGHRRDIDGYAKALTYFDERLPEILGRLKREDVLMITADHGCDPAYTKTTDHTREYTPLIIYGKNIDPINYKTRESFSDISATILKYLEIPNTIQGTSLLKMEEF
jgi:phosphopentomutase